MSARHAIWEVARREVIERARSRAMRLSFVLLLVLAIGGSVAAARIGAGTPTDDYGYVGSRGAALVPALRVQAHAAGHKLRVHRLPNRAAAVRAVRDGRVDVASVDGTLLARHSRAGDQVRAVQAAASAQRTLSELKRLGLTGSQVTEALAPRALPVQVIEPQGKETKRNRDLMFIAVNVLYIALIGFGSTIATSVTQEKSSRVVELLLTTVPPRRLLAGKVLGTGAVGLTQLVVAGGAALAAGQLAGGAGLPSNAPGTVALVLVWFVLGFAFYSVAYAAAGALISRQEDQGAAVAPLTGVMIAGFFASMAAVESPDATWAQILAFLPPFAPMLVPTRVLLGDMGPLMLVATIALQIVAIVLLVRLSARIYERAILQIGAPVKLRKILRGHRFAAAAHARAPQAQPPRDRRSRVAHHRGL